MLEIDEVRCAISRGRDWEVGDMLSDTYLDLIELATRSTMTEGIRESVAWRREKLNNHDDYIRFFV